MHACNANLTLVQMHDIDRESVNAAHVGVERDSEFATTVAKARAMHKPLPSKA